VGNLPLFTFRLKKFDYLEKDDKAKLKSAIQPVNFYIYLFYARLNEINRVIKMIFCGLGLCFVFRGEERAGGNSVSLRQA